MLKQSPRTKTLQESEKKWGREPIAAGWTIVPNTLLAKQHALGLDCIDVVIILQIVKHWWHAAHAPFPSQVQLAKTMATDISTIKRHLNHLRSNGFITWKPRYTSAGGQSANEYDLTGLIQHLRKFAAEELDERAAADDRRKERRQRKKVRPELPARSHFTRAKAKKA